MLASQINHSGIKVKFKANPGTAVSDSVYTNATGNYSINIIGGSYNIEFSKSGYQTFYYNSNQPVILTNTLVLSTASLNPGNIIVVPTGTVSGTWTNTNIYLIDGNISIPNGNTLVISPGTSIKFNGNYTLTSNGTLKAVGNQFNRILFTSNIIPQISGNWSGILLLNNSSEIKYCDIEYAYKGISVKSCSPEISFNNISRFDLAGIDLDFSSSLVTNNSIYDFNSQFYSIGIQLYQSAPILECNTIYNGKGRGIRTFSKGTIRNNVVYNISDPSRGYGIDCGAFDSSLIFNNIIHDCKFGVNVGDNITPTPRPNIINNTIYNNTVAIDINGFHSSPIIINNIIINNINGVIQHTPDCPPTCSTTPSSVSYNNTWNNTNGNYINIQILGIGQIVSTNSNGDPVDSYYNISMDPLYLNGQQPYLTGGSPCINAGNTMYSPNIGINPVNFCYGMPIGINENQKLIVNKVFPNPFVNTLYLHTFNELTHLKMTDLLGNEIPLTFEYMSENKYEIKLNNIQSGIYFLDVFSSSSKKTIKLVNCKE